MGRIRGQWFNATSNLFAFCSLAEEKEEKVHHFQQYLVRLVSLLHCAALQQVADMEEEVRTSIRCLSHVSSLLLSPRLRSHENHAVVTPSALRF